MADSTVFKIFFVFNIRFLGKVLFSPVSCDSICLYLTVKACLTLETSDASGWKMAYYIRPILRVNLLIKAPMVDTFFSMSRVRASCFYRFPILRQGTETVLYLLTPHCE